MGRPCCAQYAKKPLCLLCPMNALCAARAQGQPERYPVKTRRLKRSSHKLWLFWAERADGRVWLERRPDQGIWGGLYCLPVFDSEEALAQRLTPAQLKKAQVLPPFLHVLTHRDLHLHPVRVPWAQAAALSAGGDWFTPAQWGAAGLPAPVRKLLMSA